MMRLTLPSGFAGRARLKYGEGTPSALAGRHRRTASFAMTSLALLSFGSPPATAQQANQPGFDPRQTERRFDALESGQTQPTRPGLSLPQLARPAVGADTRLMFDLREVVLTGGWPDPPAALVTAYQPRLCTNTPHAHL